MQTIRAVATNDAEGLQEGKDGQDHRRGQMGPKERTDRTRTRVRVRGTVLRGCLAKLPTRQTA